LKPRQPISPYANRKAHWLIAHHQVSQSPQALVAFNHYSSYRYTLSSNNQATDLIRYSNFRSKSPVLIPIFQTGRSSPDAGHHRTTVGKQTELNQNHLYRSSKPVIPEQQEFLSVKCWVGGRCGAAGVGVRAQPSN